MSSWQIASSGLHESAAYPRRGEFISLPHPKMSKLDLTTDVEIRIWCWFSKCQYVVVNVQQCSLLHVLYLHNIFLTGVIGYDQLIFSKIYTPKNEILGTPLTGIGITIPTEPTNATLTSSAPSSYIRQNKTRARNRTSKLFRYIE